MPARANAEPRELRFEETTCTLAGRGLGDELVFPAGARHLVATVTLPSIVPVDHLEIIRNGEVAAEMPLRARGNRPAYPILDVYPYATTSPIYVTVGGKPVRSGAGAEYFIAWIDRLNTAAVANKNWNNKDEESPVLEMLRLAKEELVRRLAQ